MQHQVVELLNNRLRTALYLSNDSHWLLDFLRILTVPDEAALCGCYLPFGVASAARVH